MKVVPKSLKYWFFAHFLIDFLFGVPLLIAPLFLLDLFGFSGENVLMARLVGAALIGIGGVSFLKKNEGVESYNSLLSLKIIWSLAALFAILLSIFEGAPNTAWIVFAIFLIFSSVWIYYKKKL